MDGYEYLTERLHLKNVFLSYDMVLQNKRIEPKCIFNKEENFLSIPVCDSFYDKCVGIIPNAQCVKHGNGQNIIDLNYNLINHLKQSGLNVCIFRHSTDDLGLCEIIYKEFENDSHVRIIKNDFSCLEFSEFVKRFMFVICSRYHGVVNSFKSGVPCVVLGWSNKYLELCKLLSQQEYCFDIATYFDEHAIINGVDDMIENYIEEKKAISRCLCEIQKNNCFNYLDDKTYWKER